MLVLLPEGELLVVLPDVLDPVVVDVSLDMSLLEPVVPSEVVVPSVLPFVLDVVFPALVEVLPALLDVPTSLLDVPLVPTISVSDIYAVNVADALLPEESLAVTW